MIDRVVAGTESSLALQVALRTCPPPPASNLAEMESGFVVSKKESASKGPAAQGRTAKGPTAKVPNAERTAPKVPGKLPSCADSITAPDLAGVKLAMDVTARASPLPLGRSSLPSAKLDIEPGAQQGNFNMFEFPMSFTAFSGVPINRQGARS